VNEDEGQDPLRGYRVKKREYNKKVESNANMNHTVGERSGLPSTDFLLLSRKMGSCRMMSYHIRKIKPEFIKKYPKYHR
jgi:hypothetical protein